MNKKLFFKIVGVTTLISIIIAGLILTVFFFTGSGSIGGESSNELTKASKNERTNILVLGTDQSSLRSDVMMVFSLSKKDKTLNVLSIPRDTRVKIGSYYNKINTALAIGEEDLTIKVLKDTFDLPIHHVVKVSFDAVVDIVNELGGVDFYVPENLKYSDPSQDLYIDLKEGQQLLDGEKSLQLLRYRSYPLADLQRIKVQQDFIKAAFDQKVKLRYIFKVDDVYRAATSNIKTDLSLSKVLKYALIAKGVDSEDFTTYSLPGSAKMVGGASYFVHDKEETQKLIDSCFK